jgi:hypothetical protein
MASMQSLLQNYGLSDPIADSETGVFSNAELQELYETHSDIEEVAQSLRVGSRNHLAAFSGALVT